MKQLEFCILAAAALGLSSAAFAGDKVDCATLKQSIEAKLTAHGVKKFKLDVIDKAGRANGKVVGTCDGGAHKIIYSMESAPADAQK
jgi:hypothetical protein